MSTIVSTWPYSEIKDTNRISSQSNDERRHRSPPWTVASRKHSNKEGFANCAIESCISRIQITRDIEGHLQGARQARPVTVLTGARQTGKTSTLRRLFPQHAFVSLDLPTEAAQAEQDPATFLKRYPPPVMIDEVQYAPGLFRHLKSAVDPHVISTGKTY